MNTSAKLDEIKHFIKVESGSEQVVCRRCVVNLIAFPKLA